MNARAMIQEKLIEIYGEKKGKANCEYLMQTLDSYLQRKAGVTGKESPAPRGGARLDTPDGKPAGRFDNLAGKVFAICYPDNVYNDTDPTLQTLERVLLEKFPSINGIHILPERMMSHDDLWPQDLLSLMNADLALDLIEHLVELGLLASDRTVTDKRGDLSRWYENHAGSIESGRDRFLRSIDDLIDSRRRAHFNDGGFSQISRASVDPRFGDTGDIKRLSKRFSMMLDYVVNHLDIENTTLDGFRRGENDGSAFIIISPEEYERLKQNGDIDKTFRPRPFPLFTGLRKYPSEETPTTMASIFEDAGLSAPDERVTRFLSIYFKVRNNQGLTRTDRGILYDFIDLLLEKGVDSNLLFADSEIHESQPALTESAASGMEKFCDLAGIGSRYAEIFERHDDRIYGEKFFVYTTFSESQADINPVTGAGFRLIVDDLFHLLDSGDLMMLRMDAIKYLWKEIVKKNFDMAEGDILIDVIRLTLSLAAPALVPLDEVNSPDQDVYRMGRDGGFAYLFGQVNAVPAAFNGGSLAPLERLTSTMKKECPDELLLFVTLSTHDGRSVQGIGVDRLGGHVSIGAFCGLRKIIEAGGGKVKYRVFPRGVIPGETLEKACGEIGISTASLDGLFNRRDGQFVLKDASLSKEALTEAILKIAGAGSDKTTAGVVGYLADWLIDGRTAYELCCTSRAAFDHRGQDGKVLTPREEARRLALAQIFVLSFGQSVPAVYFNDLLGLGNDRSGYARSGEPRDLNRHKSHIDELNRSFGEDEFTKSYTELLNLAIRARVEDPAFYPLSPGYEFVSFHDTVFLNHVSSDNYHSLVLGNIGKKDERVRLDLAELMNMTGEYELMDRLTGQSLRPKGSVLDVMLPGYGALWLSAVL